MKSVRETEIANQEYREFITFGRRDQGEIKGDSEKFKLS